MLTKVYARFAGAAALILAIGSPGTSQMAAKDRILRPVDSSQLSILRGTAHPLARVEFDQGRISPEQPITGAVAFRLSPAQQSDLDRLLSDQQNPSSPRYHQWLTPEQYAAGFGMSQNDLAKVSLWLRSQGLTVTGISRGRTEIYFSAPAAHVETAFATQIHKYVVKSEEHFANSTALSVPQAFVDVLLNVRGLDNFRPKPMFRLRQMSLGGPSPNFTSSISGSHFLNPNDFAVIYNVTPLYSAGLDGTGVKIAVIGQTELTSTGNDTSDLKAFRSAAGLAAKDPSFVLVPSTGAASFVTRDVVEADLDLEWSNAVAPNADVTYVFSGNTGNAFDAITHAVNQGLGFAQIISNSFGLCEADIGQSQAVTLWQTIRQANSQGQTMTSASGDAGAADCDGDVATIPTSARKGLSVDIPAAIPEVTGVGGTEFSGDAVATVTGTAPNACAAATQFWLASPGTPPTCDLTSPAATAISYIPEMAWNDTATTKELSASGGGASKFFAKPSWQSGTGVPADGARDVPDIALNASPVHDPYLICSQGLCVNGFRNPNSTPTPNDLDTVGGTSAGAPTFAGVLALILQKTKATGLGNVNPMLYSLAAGSPGAFHDVIPGNNEVPCTSGTTNCPSGTTSIGFTAGQGYDQATGLGSVDASALETAWLAALVSPPPDFLMDGQASRVAPGQTGTATINITATNGFADTVNLTCTANAPSSAQISCSVNPTSVVLSSSSKTGSATLSIVTVAELVPPHIPQTRGIWLAGSGGLFAAVLLGGIPSKRRRWTSLFALVLLAMVVGAAGCGGGGGGGTPPVQKQQGTPAGSYTITVTGTGMTSTTTHTAVVSLTVL